ncbi:unnamed protein product [Alternaria alternata]
MNWRHFASGMKGWFDLVWLYPHKAQDPASRSFQTWTICCAIAGPPGSQIWAIWTHRYYNQPDKSSSENVLYVLRLVVEIDETATRLSSDAVKRPDFDAYNQQVKYLRAVLQAARAEAKSWRLDVVELWDPTPLVLDMLAQSGLEFEVVERENDSIASLLWYGECGGTDNEAPLWLNNEHYAWQ